MTETETDFKELEKLRSTEGLHESDAVKKGPERKWKILLEPALIGSMMAINLGQTSLQNLYLRTACMVDLQHKVEICERGVGDEFRLVEAESQEVVSGVNISRSFVGAFIATVVLLFVGPWSDCSGRRKPLLILPLVGMSVMSICVLLILTFPGATTAQVLYAVQIPISLGGNFGLLLAAAFSHIGDVCHSTGRDVTRTMGGHRAAIQIAHVVGAVSGPLLYRYLGFYGVFPIVLLLQLCSLIYVIIVVKDVNVNTENQIRVFNWRLPFNAFQCLLRKRDGYKRTIILLMLIVALGDRMLLSAEVLLAYMYYRFKFKFDDVLFGFFLAYRNIISFFGTLIILTILKKRFKLTDEMVGAISCISFVLSTTLLTQTASTIVVFIIPIIGIISQGSQVVQRPILNKQIVPNEQGKIYSVLGALESATQTFSSPLYSLLYKSTVSTNVDSWLIPGISLAIIQCLAYIITKRLKKDNKVPKKIHEMKDLDVEKQTIEELEIETSKLKSNDIPSIINK